MAGVVNFKFKSALAYDSVKFDGAFISVGELKSLIADKKGLGPAAGQELLLSDPKTKQEYTDAAQLIPKNSSVVVKRTPAGRQQATIVAADPDLPAQGHLRPPGAYHTDELGGDLYSQQPRQKPVGAEDEALQAALDRTQEDWAAGRGGRARGRGRGRGRMGIREAPPPHYRCHRCLEPGHWIDSCPTLDDPDFRPKLRPTGIPHSMMAASDDGSLLLADGTTAVLQPNEAGFHQEMAALTALPEAKAATNVLGTNTPAAVSLSAASSAPPAKSAPPAAIPLLDNKPHKPLRSLPLPSGPAAEAPILAGDSAELPDGNALALAAPRLPAGFPPLPFPMPGGPPRPFLPPVIPAEANSEPPAELSGSGRPPADVMLQALASGAAGPMGPAEFALLQAAMRQRKDGGEWHRTSSRRSRSRSKSRSRSRSRGRHRDSNSNHRHRRSGSAHRSHRRDSRSPSRSRSRSRSRDRGFASRSRYRSARHELLRRRTRSRTPDRPRRHSSRAKPDTPRQSRLIQSGFDQLPDEAPFDAPPARPARRREASPSAKREAASFATSPKAAAAAPADEAPVLLGDAFVHEFGDSDLRGPRQPLASPKMKMPPARGGPIRPSDRWQPVPDAAQPKTQGPAPAQATAPAAAAAAAVAVPSKPAGQPASGRSAGSAKQETSKRVHTSEGAQADGAVDGAARTEHKRRRLSEDGKVSTQPPPSSSAAAVAKRESQPQAGKVQEKVGAAPQQDKAAHSVSVTQQAKQQVQQKSPEPAFSEPSPLPATFTVPVPVSSESKDERRKRKKHKKEKEKDKDKDKSKSKKHSKHRHAEQEARQTQGEVTQILHSDAPQPATAAAQPSSVAAPDTHSTEPAVPPNNPGQVAFVLHDSPAHGAVLQSEVVISKAGSGSLRKGRTGSLFSSAIRDLGDSQKGSLSKSGSEKKKRSR